jgi:uncharacterized membrane protein
MIKGKNKLIAAFIVLVGILLTAYALLSPTSDVHSSMMGIPVTTSSYSLAEMLLAIIGTFMIGAGTAFILFKEDYEPIADVILAPSEERGKVEPGPSEVTPTGPAVVAVGEGPIARSSDNTVDERRLVLRLLTGDERTMFRAIVESGGEALQKDLILKTKMSDAKVSRVLDKLVEKGVLQGPSRGDQQGQD